MDEVPENAVSLNAAYAELRQQGQSRKTSNFFAGAVICVPCNRNPIPRIQTEPV